VTAPLRLQQLLPTAGDIDIAVAYGDALGPVPVDRPHVSVNMVASVDGRTAVEGRTGMLSSPPDRAIFRLLRSLADVVLVGAETVRAESYGTVKTSDEVRTNRAARGQKPAAALAIVTRSLHLDWSSRLFAEPTQRPFVIAPFDAEPEALRAAAKVASVIRAGTGTVDLREALRQLRQEHGVQRVLCEGGPTLNTQLVTAGVLDQLCLTVSPQLVGGDSKTILAAAGLDAPLPLELVSALVADGELFLRYVVRGSEIVAKP
jgi:riboflavin-specific deaminase-like protein